MLSQNDPSTAYFLAMFESEEKAREREQDPRRQEVQQIIKAKMADLLDGPPEFVDMTVIGEF